MLTGLGLDRAIQAATTRPVRGTWWRALGPAEANDPLGKLRTTVLATRYNIRSGARMLFLSRDAHTALKETEAFGSPPATRTVVPVAFDLKAVLDLTQLAVRLVLRLSQADLTQNHRSVNARGGTTPTQALGERCAALACVDGILFESLADPPNPNLTIVEKALAPLGSLVSIHQPPLIDKLP